MAPAPLGDVVVLVGVVLVPLHVVTVYQRLDTLLQVWRGGGEDEEEEDVQEEGGHSG